jgi:hypothetical protein
LTAASLATAGSPAGIQKKKTGATKKWSDNPAWTPAPSQPVAMSVALGVELGAILREALDYSPRLPDRDDCWVTLNPGSGNAGAKSLFKRIAQIFVGHPADAWLQATEDEKMSAASSRDAGYVLLYVAHSIENDGRVPSNFSSHLFEASGTPVKRVAHPRIEDVADSTGIRSLAAEFEHADVEGTAPFSVKDDETDPTQASGVGPPALARERQSKASANGDRRAPRHGNESELARAEVVYLQARIKVAKEAGDFKLACTLTEQLSVASAPQALAQGFHPPPQPPATPPTDLNVRLLSLLEKLAGGASTPTTAAEDVVVTKAAPILGKAVSADDLFKRGEMPAAQLRDLRLYKYICYIHLYHNSSAASLVGKSKTRSISIASGATLKFDNDVDVIKDATTREVRSRTYTQWDAAARIVERTMLRERPAEYEGFIIHQERVRDFQRDYRVERPGGFLEYDMMVRKLAATAQVGLDGKPFLWEAECGKIFRQIFGGATPGKCENCGSVAHYASECSAARIRAELNARTTKTPPDRTDTDANRQPDPDALSRSQKKKAAKLARDRAAAAAGTGNDTKTAAGTTATPRMVRIRKFGDQPCHRWNDGKCDNKNCDFSHEICRKCGGSHRWTDKSCPQYDETAMKNYLATRRTLGRG